MIEIAAADGTAEAYLARPDDADHPGVLLFMDAFGIRPWLQEMADRIAGWGYTVLVPNLLYRSGSVAEVAPSVDLTVPENRQATFAAIAPRLQVLTPEAMRRDVAAYLEGLRAQPGVGEDRVGVTGYCMGARFATYAAADPQVAAVGGFHGGRLATDDTDSPHLAFASSKAECVYLHADNDASMPPEAVERLGEALREHGLTAVNEIVPGAAHGYTMRDTSSYDEAACKRHFAALQELFARTLG